MARGRLISRSLGSSRRYAALQKQAGKLGEFAQSLYPLLVANADDFGRQSGDAFTVKHAVFPSSVRREEDFDAALNAMHHVGLIQLYETHGVQVIQIVGFDEHQPGLSRRTQSRFSESPVNFTATPGISLLTEQNRTEPKGTEEKRTAPMRRTDDGFESFWVSYPKKKSRSDAERAWRKLSPSPELSQRILDAVAAQRNSPDWLKEGGQFIPYPASWLNGKRWEDEAFEAAVVEAIEDVRSWCQHPNGCPNREYHENILRMEARNKANAL